ncbi:MAG TPA: YtxH domain-containing protein [Terriglobales bacterium]|nr:YtxH domain-containing protein [Terriglobales bacterium]
MSERDSNSFLWFLAGLGLGAAVGVLYAPFSGEETRRTIREKAEEGRDYVRGRAREVREQAQGWANRSREAMNQQRDQFKAAYEAGRQAYRDNTTPEKESPQNL